MITRYEQQQRRIEWRRNKVRELSVKGHTQRQIADILHIANVTVFEDLQWMRQQAKEGITRYIDEYLPAEYENCLMGLNEILTEAWNISNTTEDNRERLAALELAKGCYSMKLDLLSSATVVDRAVKFVDLQKAKILPLGNIDENGNPLIEDDSSESK